MSYQRDFDRKVRVAFVGLGSHCYRNLLPCATFLPLTIQAMCDRDESVLGKTAAQYGVARTYTRTEALYEREKGLDAVIICTGPDTHPRLAREALDAGLHVWMEKPPAMRAAEIEEVIAHQGDRVVVVGVKKAFSPAIRKAKELLTLAESGALLSVACEYGMEIPPDGPEVLRDRRMNQWLGNGVHPVSALLALGGPAKAVTVHQGPAGGGAVILEHEGGAIGILHLAKGKKACEERYAIFAENCQVIIEDGRRVIYDRGTPLRYGVSTDFAPPGFDHGAVVWEAHNSLATLENKALFLQGIWGELSHFCQCILDGTPPSTGSLDFALNLMRVYEAGMLSQGARIVIPTQHAAGHWERQINHEP